MNKDEIIYVPISVEEAKNMPDIIYGIQTDEKGKPLVSFDCLCFKPIPLSEIAEQNKVLVDALKELIRCSAVFKDNLLSADVTIYEYNDAINKAKEALKQHNK